MDLTTPTTSFECTISDGLAHIVLNQPDRGNPIDGVFCREFNLGVAELSERDDVRAVLISARGKLFSVGGDLVALAASGDNLPQTVKIWTSDLHHAIVRMVRMRAPVVMAVQGNVAGGSVSLMAAGDMVVIGKSARISAAFARIGFTPDSGSTTTVTRRIGPSRARRRWCCSVTAWALLPRSSISSITAIYWTVSPFPGPPRSTCSAPQRCRAAGNWRISMPPSSRRERRSTG